jgi:uncharacterized protein YndB with AHSA1/START domain
MVKFNVMNEAIIDVDPSTVFKAILDELRGYTNWWMAPAE